VRVRQILVNLLSNAIKFTETGNIWVEVQELPENRVAIAVRDTGIGIAPQDFKQIFEAFRQIDQSITRKYPGTGLGLAIIHSLVQVMGGKIFLESQLGIGSIFKVELPRQISSKNRDGKVTALNVDSKNIFFSTNNSHESSPPSRNSSMRYPNLKL
jgi:signal transduction histidine kinase